MTLIVHMELHVVIGAEHIKNNNKKNMKLKLIPILFLLLSCNNNTNNSSDSGIESYEKEKTSVENYEKNSPVSFLKLKYSTHKNLIGKLVVNGEIKNTAKLATYKDIVLQIDFYSKTNTLLSSQNETIYEYIEASKTSSFKFKLDCPTDTERVNCSIVNAKETQ